MTRAAAAGRSTDKSLNYLMNGTLGKKDKHEIHRFDSLSGYTKYDSGQTSVHTLEEIEGHSCVKVVTSAGSGSSYSEIRLTGLDFAPPHRNARLVFFVYCDRPDLIVDMRAFYLIASNARFTQYTMPINTGTTRKVHEVAGWHTWGNCERISTNSFLPDTDHINEVKVRVVPVAGESVTFYVHSAWFINYRKPSYVIGFDDNWRGILVGEASVTLGGVPGTYSAKDILAYYDMPATLWVVGSLVGADALHLSADELKELYDAGFDIQAQCFIDANSNGSEGTALLGPYGYTPRAIASVDTSANTITASAAHWFNSAGTYASPVLFTGTDLPAPLLADTVYWARMTSTTAFTLHAIKSDSISGANIIDITTTGTPANFFWRYGFASNDTSALLEDYANIDALFASVGIPPAKYLGVNQGSMDRHVYAAAKEYGYRYIRGTQAIDFALPINITDLDVTPIYGGSCIDLVVTTDANIKAQVNRIIKNGCMGTSFTHRCDTTNMNKLITLCEHLSQMRKAGLIDVLTISQWYEKNTV